MVSYALWFLARVQLGQSLVFLAKADGPLITTGLYKKFRNPIYLFGTVSLTSYLMLIDKPLYLLILFVLIPVQLIRSNLETRILRKKYDEQYDDYVKSVWI